MVESKTWRPNGLEYKLLFWLEKKQLQKAKEVICATEAMIPYSQATYHITKPRYFVKPACVDLTLFRPQGNGPVQAGALGLKKRVCVYAGKFGGIYLEKEVFSFFKVASEIWKDEFSVLLLTSHSAIEIQKYCLQSGFDYNLVVQRNVSHQEVPKYLALGSFGICPVKPLPSKRYCTPIKDGEYWAMGLPIVITNNISDDSAIIENENIGAVLHTLNDEAYAIAVKKIDSLLLSEEGLGSRIREVAEKYRNFSISERVYSSIYSD
jgi:glycosyltransferase involved in cell wall biosynthesis